MTIAILGRFSLGKQTLGHGTIEVTQSALSQILECAALENLVVWDRFVNVEEALAAEIIC